MKRSLYLAIAAIALVAMPRVSHAQLGALKPFSLGVAGGIAQPMSDLSDAAKLGYNATAALELHLPLIPVGIRVDGAYNSFGEKITGAGINLPVSFLKAFVEARYNSISANGSTMQFVPVTVGIMF